VIVGLIFVCLAAIVGFVVAGVIDALDERRPLPRVVQPVRRVPPAPWTEGEFLRARRARAARARRRSTGGTR